MTKTYSFTAFLNNGGNGNNNNGGGVASGEGGRRIPKSEKMEKFYFDLCESKAVTPDNIDPWTVKQLSMEIERLRALPYPASQGQKDMIKDIINQINDLAPTDEEREVYDELFIKTLTGGREGSASSYIQTLIDRRKELSIYAKATDEQAEAITSWRLCSEIPWEEFGLEQWTYLKKLSYWSSEYNVPEDLEVRPKQFKTDEEFMAQIKAKFTQQSANDFMSKYRGTYFTWKKTRITQSQITTIRKIEQELADIWAPKEVEVAVDENGEKVEFHTHSYRDRKNGIESAYQPLAERDLLQMSNKEATAWIYQLSAERDDERLRSVGHGYDESQGEFNDKHRSYDVDRGNQMSESADGKTELKRVGLAKNQSDARIREYSALNDLVFKLESLLGYQDDNLHDMVKESILDMKDEQSLDTRNEIMSMMFSTLNMEKQSEAFKGVGRLYAMSEESLIATDICEEINSIVTNHFNQ